MAFLLDEIGAILLDELGEALLEEGDDSPEIIRETTREFSAQYAIDLCVGWMRVAEATACVFDGVVRNLAAGEWRLAGAVDSLAFVPGYTLSDVDTIRIISDADIVFAGFVTPITAGVGGLNVTHSSDGERFTLTGPDAWAVLASRVAYPTPATGPPWADSHDVRTGLASTVAAGYITDNAGVGATVDRQIPGLTVVDGSAGTSGEWSARLQPLDQLVARVCRDGGITCRIVIGYDGTIQVTVCAPRDRRTTTVLSDQGDLTNIQHISVPTTTTFVIAGGQGNLTARTFASAGSAIGVARREVFSDQSSLASSTEVQQAANTQLLSDSAMLTVRAEATDTASLTFEYLAGYNIGDTIAAEIGTIRYPVVIESVTFQISPERSVIRPVLGDAAPNLVTGLIRDVAGLTARLDTQIA